jgi:hypothetical protein
MTKLRIKVCVVCTLKVFDFSSPSLSLYLYSEQLCGISVSVSNGTGRRRYTGAYKLSEYSAKLDDRCIFCNKIVHTSFRSTFQEDNDVQIAVGTRVEPPQIPGHTNYARSVRQPFPSNTDLRFSREMAVANIGPFQILRSQCVTDTNFTILRHLLLKLWRNEILR